MAQIRSSMRAYHPDGLRKSKTFGSTTHNYHYDGTQLVRVTDNSHKTVWAYTWNNGKVVSVTNAAGEEFETITNYRGDVVQILDGTGTSIATYDYDPWGNLVSTEPIDARILSQPIRYAGYVYDVETKLYYLQARYYDPATACFISRDPDPGDEDDPITMNGYSYADGNPIMKTDPDGNWAWVVVNVGFAIYDGYKAYKAGKNKKQIAWAVASSFVGVGTVKRISRVSKVLKGVKSDYRDVTKKGSTVKNRETNLTRKQFETNLSNSGWKKTKSQTSDVLIFQKSGNKYSVRNKSKYYPGPTAEFTPKGRKKATVKIRLRNR